jgi:hypothetical protein
VTCKRRRVVSLRAFGLLIYWLIPAQKCDEERPVCKRCVTGNRECEGYEEAPKHLWPVDGSHDISHSFPEDPNGSTTRLGEPLGQLVPNDAIRIIGRDRKCTRCGLAHNEIACPSSLVPTFVRPADSPYRKQSEQYLFKFFIEVVGAAVSRSNISTYYWLGAFPQIAYETPSVKDMLLAVSAAFHSASGDIFVKQIPTMGASGLMYESRAMRSLSRGNPSIYEMLNTSMAFWVCSMVVGGYRTGLQHLYFCLKIISGLEDTSPYDQMQLKYQVALARIGLQYFRITRGPCKKHGPCDFLDCDPECFIPADEPFADRVADALHHLQAALPSFELCADLLQTRMEPHSHQAELEAMLEKELNEVRFLIATWSDREHLGISEEEWESALKRVPYSASPFDAVISDLIRYVVNDQYTTGIAFQELELRTRVIIPHMVSSSSRGNPVMGADSLALMLYGGYTEGLLKVRGNFKLAGKHVNILFANSKT